MSYIVKGIDPAPYGSLFGLPDDELAKHGVVRMTVSAKPSFPCRVSLTDRDIGESVLLLNHVSHDVANPYRASHAIFVTEGADRRRPNMSMRSRRCSKPGCCRCAGSTRME
jgi:hypothetical protein